MGGETIFSANRDLSEFDDKYEVLDAVVSKSNDVDLFKKDQSNSINDSKEHRIKDFANRGNEALQKKRNRGKIVGIIFGAIAAVIVTIGATCFLTKKFRADQVLDFPKEKSYRLINITVDKETATDSAVSEQASSASTSDDSKTIQNDGSVRATKVVANEIHRQLANSHDQFNLKDSLCDGIEPVNREFETNYESRDKEFVRIGNFDYPFDVGNARDVQNFGDIEEFAERLSELKGQAYAQDVINNTYEMVENNEILRAFAPVFIYINLKKELGE